MGAAARQVLVGDDLVAQVGQALRNIVAVLAEAGAGPEHVARLTWYVLDRRAYRDRSAEIGAAYRRCFGPHYPAMTLIEVAGLPEPGALVEIEATAVLPDQPEPSPGSGAAPPPRPAEPRPARAA